MAHSVGQVIATLRKGKGWTQVELAEKLGVTDKAVSKWETDGGIPDTPLFPVIADLFGVTTDYLHTGIMKDGEKETVHPVPPTNPSAGQTEADMDRIIRSCTKDGVISIDKLAETRNYPLMKRAFDLGYIHPFEVEYYKRVTLPQKLYDEQNWRELFRYCVDMEYTSMAWAVAQRDEYPKEFASQIKDQARIIPCDSCINDECLRKCRDVWPRHGFYPYSSLPAQERMAVLAKCRQQILEDLAKKWDKETTVGDLTKEYFDSEMAKGNTEMVIIKLCKRLEAILRSDYHYDGDLAAMMDRYCSAYVREDDGWGYDRECKFVSKFHMLRKYRNSIVHSEINGEVMSEEDVRFCIEYICEMG